MKWIKLLILLFIPFIISQHSITQNKYCAKELTDTSLKEELILNNIKHPEIVFRQAIIESGHFTSGVFVENNNLFGMTHPRTRPTYSMKKNRGFAYYKDWTHSVKDYKVWQDKYYKGGDYYLF